MRSLDGRKLLWCWHPEGQFRDPKDLARIALDAGVTALALKVDNGGYPFSDAGTDFGRRPDRIIDYIQAMRGAGVQAGLWGYHYGYDLDREASIVHRTINFQPDFYIIDWEAEFMQRKGGVVPIRRYLGSIRGFRNKHAPDMGLFHAPLAQPRYHQPWIYRLFQEYLDGMMPQIYHGAMELPYPEALSRSYEDYAQYGLMNKPIWPAGQAYDLVPQEVLAWGTQAVRVYGAKGLSWWKLEDAYYNGALEAIRGISLEEDSMRRVNGLHPHFLEPMVLRVGLHQIPLRKPFGLLAGDNRVVLDLEVLGVPSGHGDWPVTIIRDGDGAYAGYLDGAKTRDQISVYMSAGPDGNITLEVQRAAAKVVLFGILEVS